MFELDATKVKNFFLSENKSITLNYTNRITVLHVVPKGSSYLCGDIEQASQL